MHIREQAATLSDPLKRRAIEMREPVLSNLCCTQFVNGRNWLLLSDIFPHKPLQGAWTEWKKTFDLFTISTVVCVYRMDLASPPASYSLISIDVCVNIAFYIHDLNCTCRKLYGCYLPPSTLLVLASLLQGAF